MTHNLNDKDLRQQSKYLSLLLRHKPDEIGLNLDECGWADIDEIIAKATLPLTRSGIIQIVESSDKQRFALSLDGQRIRANQGHSFPVDLGFSPSVPPDTLFHGTSETSVPTILAQGLKPMSRQHVHLSSDAATARTVGQRHGKPVILRIDAAKMEGDDHHFFLSENGVWLTHYVPAGYIRKADETD